MPLHKLPSSTQSLSMLQIPQMFLPAVHDPATQVSPLVHLLPSSQALLLGTNEQPLTGLQLSSVQTLLSSHTIGVPPQTPVVH